MERYSNPDIVYSYKYEAVSHSLLDKVFRHWLNYAFRFVPPRMSPNLLSMIGNVGSWFALWLLILFGDSSSPRLRILFGIASFSVFFYHTVDNLDGRQARRLGCYGPLGEFVDHWFDSFNVFFFPLGAVAIFPGVPFSWAVGLLVLSTVADWIVLREVYKTNRMYFGPVSTDEGIAFYWLFLFAIFLLGRDFWALPHPVLGFPPCLLMFPCYAIALIGTIVMTLIKNRFLGFGHVLVELLFFVPVVCWILAAKPILGYRFALISGLLLIGFIGSRHIGDLLRARLVGLEYPVFYPDLAVYSLAVLAVSVLSLVGVPLPRWLVVFPAVVLFVDTAHALVLQFLRMIRRVYDCLGITLFGFPDAEKVAVVEAYTRK